MYTAKRFTCVLLFGLLLSHSSAVPPSPWQQLVQRFSDQKGFSGMVVVVQNGKTVYQGAFGNNGTSSQTPNTVNTRFRVASVSKLLLAVTVLRLQEQGKLRLEDPLGNYLPTLPLELRRVTLRQLLMHSSGLPDPEGRGPQSISPYLERLSLDDFISRYATAPLEFVPGSRFRYNNLDYIVLSKVIEWASREPWASAVGRRVLEPAGMVDSGFVQEDFDPQSIAQAQYRSDSGQWLPDPAFYVANYFGAGALYATAPDLERFDTALRADKLLTRASQDELFRAIPSLGYVALGNWVYPQKFGARMVSISERYGNLWGSFAVLARAMDQANTVIVLSNRHDVGANLENDLKTELLARLYR